MSSLFVDAQTNIGGVINSYYAVESIQTNVARLTLEQTSGIGVGDTMLLMQMQGAEIDRTESSSYGEVTDYLGTGLFEWVEICEVIGNDVVLKKHLEKSYSAVGLQLISCPSYNDVLVTNKLTCQPWDGNTGGVLIFRSLGTVSLQDTIDVSGKGFRGGDWIDAVDTCNFLSNYDEYAYATNTTLGGMKGEGISLRDYDNLGRGPNANGGGGGNDHNAGGAGGSNISIGGIGGKNLDPGAWNCKGKFPGIGGYALDTTGSRLFMGGGGGCGHNNSSQVSNDAGDGGGIVMIFANEIISNGHAIIADGTDGLLGFGDGGSGGGAGGTIRLDIANYTGNILVSAKGGNGGDGDGAIPFSQNSDRCFGPGGGGSGGVIYVAQSTLPLQILAELSGGLNGVVSNTTASCIGDANGAEPGEDGVIVTTSPIVAMSRIANKTCGLIPVFSLGNDTTLCTGESLQLSIPNAGIYLWSTGANTQTITVTNPGTYIGQVDDGVCIIIDTISVYFENNQDTTYSLEICKEVDTEITPYISGSDYQWNTGDTSSTIWVNDAGNYSVVYKGTKCYFKDSIIVTTIPYEDPFVGQAFKLCEYEGIELDAKNEGSTYEWSSGETTQTIQVIEKGAYTVIIDLGSNCVKDFTASVEECEIELIIPNTISPNGDNVNDSWIINNIYSYPGNKVKIYDRAGALIFETTDYQNDWNGAGYPDGTYYFTVRLSEDLFQKGSITVVREE